MGNAGERWKQHERDWAGFAGGERVPSQGVAREDLRSLPDEPICWTAEHKTVKAVPAWMSKQISQARGNRERKPGHLPLMMTTIAPGQGIKVTHILGMELDFARDQFVDAVYWLLKSLRQQEGLPV